MPLPFPFDWKKPDYTAVIEWRLERIRRIRENPACVPTLIDYYREHIGQFIIDWGVTGDPRNVEIGLPVMMPFLLFPKQEEWIDWVLERWHKREPGLTEKSRDSGVSWMSVGLSCSLCMFYEGVGIGFGSRKQEYVDELGAPKSLLEKGRVFMNGLPPEFNGGWDPRFHGLHMRLLFARTGSIITGEVGDSIGRGDRTSLYFVDEAAFLEHPLMADSGLSATTNCRIDISTPNGPGNPFAQKRRSGKIPIFTFHWRHDPRKDQAWYDRQCGILTATIVASDIDISYAGSVEGAIIPAAWITEAIGAHLKLKIEPSGERRAGFDVADRGADLNALAVRHGFLLHHLVSWSGRGADTGDIFKSVIKVFGLCDEHKLSVFYYDADGLGSGVRGDANKINEERREAAVREIDAAPFQGSGEIYDPEGEMVAERTNRDFFANLKAQCWWALRLRFQATHRALAGQPYNPDDIISIDPALPELDALQMELAQPICHVNTVGKTVIDKAPEGTVSPNLADAVMIAFAPVLDSMEVWRKLGETT